MRNEREQGDVIQAIEARLRNQSWSTPGVRYVGLSQSDLSLLAETGNYVVANSSQGVTVTRERSDLRETSTLDANGRLIRDEWGEISDYDPASYTLTYDELGRLVSHHFSGDGWSIPSSSRTESFEYPEGQPDDHFTQTIETDAFGHKVRRITWEARQALEVLKREGYQ